MFLNHKDINKETIESFEPCCIYLGKLHCSLVLRQQMLLDLCIIQI